eukprot:2159918-Prymnesium_polylepis.1
MRRKRYPKSSRGWWVVRVAGAASGRGRRAVRCTCSVKLKRSQRRTLNFMVYAFGSVPRGERSDRGGARRRLHHRAACTTETRAFSRGRPGRAAASEQLFAPFSRRID